MSTSTLDPQPIDQTGRTGRVTVGVDTHQRTHHAAVLDAGGREVADRQFPATAAGYAALIGWARGHGVLTAAGVESTGSYGAGLTRELLAAGIEVYEVSGPEKSTRAGHGKSDPIDAYSAARQVHTGRVTARAKDTTQTVESLRVLKVARDGAVKARTAAYSQLRDLITTAPTGLHDQLIGATGTQRVKRALALRPDPTNLTDPTQATKHALRALARRIRELSIEIAEADRAMATLTARACPTLIALPQVGTQTAAQLAITAGNNIDRMTSEARFAKLAGVAPLPASSGKTNRHRLNRGGDRAANSALYMIVVGRMAHHPETIAYATRRRAEGMSNPEIIRCLKRHLARTLYRALKTDLAAT